MKRNFVVRMIALLLVLACAVGFTACGDGEITGTYRFQKMEGAGMSLDFEELVSMYAGEGEDSFAINLVLNEDKTLKLNMDAVDSGLSLEGTWEADGNKLIFMIDGMVTEAAVKSGVITIVEDGMTMTFKK